jgi:hypothetical protein
MVRIFHLKYPHMKHEENSGRGDRYAKRHAFGAIDLDMLITADNRIVNTHWDHPMLRDGFRDPLRRILPSKRVRDLTWRQVSRLVAGRFPRYYRIRPIERALTHCARLGLTAQLEPKDDPRFAEDWPWQHIRAVADDVGCHVRVYALPQNAAALAPARRAGFQAWEIR